MKERKIEDELVQWELYKAYGQFNLCFESVVAAFRKFLVELVQRSYGFENELEDPKDNEPVENQMKDRLMKIILYDNGAFAIVEKCRSCFFDMANPKVQLVLAENGIPPLPIDETSIKIGELIFKHAIDLIKLRNIIIHSNYQGVVFNIIPKSSLKGNKDAKISKGYEERKYELTVQFLNKLVAQVEYLEFYLYQLNYAVTGKGNEVFTEHNFVELKKMDFNLPKT